ncbi:MAG TPA: hypothetical protein PLW65_15430 [Pseudomonadota bacterium]|nr:hypothetical protein [Pseudomonadota bacterium]
MKTKSFPTARRAGSRRTLLLVGALAASACGIENTQSRLDALQELVAFQGQQLKHLEAELNDALKIALCSPDIRQLLEDVQKECSPPAAPSPGPNVPGAVCTTTQIRPAVIAVDPEHRGRFLKLMAHLPHEVFYFSSGRRQLAPHREERLDRLARQALLRSTMFLIVSSPESGEEEAARRALDMEGYLQARGIPRDRVRRWIYAFPATRVDIPRATDLPGLGETRDLHRGVWVFRADC